MPENPAQSSQQLQSSAAKLFNGANALPQALEMIEDAAARLANEFFAARTTLSPAQLADLKDRAAALQAGLQENLLSQIDIELLARHEATITGWLSSFSDPDAPNVGKDFLHLIDETSCRKVIEPTQDCIARYVSYSYAPSNKGFVNEVTINPHQIDNIFRLYCALVHELPHAFQKYSCPALHHSPFNPDKNVIVHPADWILLENLCERDAYAKQAWMNSLLSGIHPEVREQSAVDLIPVAEFESFRAHAGSLQGGLMQAALYGFDGRILTNGGLGFDEHYQLVAVNNYLAGMGQRKAAGESGHGFVRLEADDFFKLGDYGVGPNTFGGNFDFLTRAKLSQSVQDKLDALCAQYDIPRLEDCMTLREYEAGYLPRLTGETQFNNNNDVVSVIDQPRADYAAPMPA